MLQVGLTAALLAACGGEEPARDAVFDLPREGEAHAFFDLPWPNDLYVDESGFIDVRQFPNPARNPTLADYIEAISTRLRGWGTNGAAYLRFEASVDEGSLPLTPEETLAEGASVFLIDVDPDSPTRGQRHPGVVVYRDEATVYWPDHCVAIRPVYGMPLAGGRTYAAVVTRDVTAADGGRFTRSRDFAALVDGGGGAVVEAGRDIYGPALDVIEESGVPREHVLSLAVFTTHDPTAELVTIRDWMIDSYPVPEPVEGDWAWVEDADGYTHVEGRYGPVPMFQSGDPPYDAEGSGEIRFEGGEPVVSQEVDVRFTMSIPTTPMPAGGYPVVLYAHGTGGDWKTFIRNDVATDLAAEGYATVIANSDEDPELQAKLVGSMIEHGVSAMVISPAYGGADETFDQLARSGLPVLQVLRRMDERTDLFPFASFDYATGSAKATRHLLDLGARNVAFVGGLPGRAITRERKSGWREVLKAEGMTEIVVHGKSSRAFGMQAAGTLLAYHPDVDAAVCFNDLVALGLMAGFAREGLGVGTAFRVVGFDDIEEAAQVWPPLSSVACDIGGFARDTATRLLAWMVEGDRPAPDIRMPVRLIARASSTGQPE